MRYIYKGNAYGIIKCSSYDIAIKVISSGEWFRTESMDFYRRSLPCEVGSGLVLPQNVALLRGVCVTAETIKNARFYKFEPHENSFEGKIYAGEDLKSLICKELKQWALNMNPKTLRAFSGKSFESYLKAIPREIFLERGFDKKMKTALKSGFITRMNKSSSQNELQPIMNLAEKSLEFLEDNFKCKSRDQEVLKEKTQESFENVKDKNKIKLKNIFTSSKKEKTKSP